jgi:hypothetical protein
MTPHEEFRELVKERNYNVIELLTIMNLVDEKTIDRIVKYLKGNYDR